MLNANTIISSGVKSHWSKRIGVSVARLVHNNTLSHACVGRSCKHLCGKLRFRQCKYVWFPGILREAVSVDRIVSCDRIRYPFARLQDIWGICLSDIRRRHTHTCSHYISCSRYKRIEIMACVRACEPSARGVWQIRHGSCACKAIRFI